MNQKSLHQQVGTHTPTPTPNPNSDPDPTLTLTLILAQVLRWDLVGRKLILQIELLPLLPTVDIVGNDLEWDGAMCTLTYQVKEGRMPSVWSVFYLDEAAGVLAARSSVTGLNIIRRIQE